MLEEDDICDLSYTQNFQKGELAPQCESINLVEGNDYRHLRNESV